jgi:hypothetical protein
MRDILSSRPSVPFTRRRVLRGLGLAVALPAFESLWALPARGAVPGPGTASSGAPLRLAFVYFPNGAIQPHWWPTGTDKAFELARTMQPLARWKGSLQVHGGLDHVHATAGKDGAGDHARASGTFLTGVRVRKTAGSDIQAGISIDQVVANQIGHLTRFPSLELTCDSVRKSGNCDSGYSCAYQYNLSWRGPATPVAPEPNPRLVFERLFGAGPHGARRENLRRRQGQQRSILDFVADDARVLQRQLDGRDTQKLDEYLTSVREIERRIERAERVGLPPDPAVKTPDGIPPSFEEHLQVMFDLLVLAFQTDSTRVATFLLANEGSNRAFPEINIAEGHHYLSHHQGNQELIDKVAEIDLFYMRQFARFIEALDDDPLRVRERGRQPAQPHQPAGVAGRSWGRNAGARAVRAAPRPADEQPVPVAGRTHGRHGRRPLRGLDRAPRRPLKSRARRGRLAPRGSRPAGRGGGRVTSR